MPPDRHTCPGFQPFMCSFGEIQISIGKSWKFCNVIRNSESRIISWFEKRRELPRETKNNRHSV